MWKKQDIIRSTVNQEVLMRKRRSENDSNPTEKLFYEMMQSASWKLWQSRNSHSFVIDV